MLHMYFVCMNVRTWSVIEARSISCLCECVQVMTSGAIFAQLEAEGHGNRGSCSRCDMRGQDPVSVTFSAGSGKWRPTGSPLMWNHKKKHWYLNGLKLKEGWMVARVRICCRPEHWDLSTLLRLHMRLSLPVEMVYGDFLTTSFALVPSPTKDDSPTEAEEGATTVSH